VPSASSERNSGNKMPLFSWREARINAPSALNRDGQSVLAMRLLLAHGKSKGTPPAMPLVPNACGLPVYFASL